MTAPKWHHGHSWVAGLLCGVLLVAHLWLLLLACFAVGMLVGRLWGTWSYVRGVIQERLRHGYTGRSRRGTARGRRVVLADPPVSQTDKIPF